MADTGITATVSGEIALRTPRFFGALTLLAPVLLLTSTVLFLITTGDINNGVVGGTVSVWASFALMFAFIGISRSLEARAPRGATFVLITAVVGVMTGLSYSVQAIDLAVTGSAFMTTEPEGWNALGQLAFDPWGFGLPLALLATAILAWRTRVFPRWAGIPLLLAAILFIPSRELGIAVLPVISDVLLIAGLAPIGVAMFTADRTHTDRRNSRAAEQ